MLSKLINLIKAYQYQIFLAACIGLISFMSYNLGQIEALEKSPIKIVENKKLKTDNTNLKADIYSASQIKTDNQLKTKILDTRVVVSKSSSSKKYHYTWCAGAAKIKLENQIWFSSDKEAEAAGYMLAGNCQP